MGHLDDPDKIRKKLQEETSERTEVEKRNNEEQLTRIANYQEEIRPLLNEFRQKMEDEGFYFLDYQETYLDPFYVRVKDKYYLFSPAGLRYTKLDSRSPQGDLVGPKLPNEWFEKLLEKLFGIKNEPEIDELRIALNEALKDAMNHGVTYFKETKAPSGSYF